MDSERLARQELLLGQEGNERLAKSRVAVFGLGGVGAYAAEALARAGVGALDLIDHDTVSASNINRQLIALSDTVGRYKADVMAERVLEINPDCRVRGLKLFYLPDTASEIDMGEYDYVLDAIDTVTGKLLIIERATATGTPVISAMGTGNKLDPTAFTVADLAETSVCPLARIMRKELKKRGIEHVKVVYSKEKPIERKAEREGASEANGDAQEGAASGGEACEKRTKDIPGSVSFVPAVAGFIMAGEVIKSLSAGENR